jgi:thioredoxin reductase (NADPH)
MHDVIIVGAGPSGLACAIEAQSAGLDYLVIEKGCIVNSLQHYPVQMAFFTTPELLEIGGLPFVCEREKPTRFEGLKYYRRVADTYRLKINLYETALGAKGKDGDFTLCTQTRKGVSQHYQCRKMVLATGYYDIPNTLNVPGEDLPKVTHYYTEPHPYYHMDVAVIGGRNSAAIAALELYRSGARVTLIHRGAELSSSVKYWIKPDIENRIKNQDITACFRTQVIRITPDRLVLQNDIGEIWEIPNDYVFAMTGYRPDVEFFKSLGIQINPVNQKPSYDKDTYESNVPGIYLAGVVLAGAMTNEIFIENGRFHGTVIIRHIRRVLPKS